MLKRYMQRDYRHARTFLVWIICIKDGEKQFVYRYFIKELQIESKS